VHPEVHGVGETESASGCRTGVQAIGGFAREDALLYLEANHPHEKRVPVRWEVRKEIATVVIALCANRRSFDDD
jgi:hypothetical protein